MEKTIQKATACLSLGIEMKLGKGPAPADAAALIETRFLEDIFRNGSRACIRLKGKAEKWYLHSFIREKNLPLSFLSETFLGVIGGLFLDRPLFYDNYARGKLYTHFSSLDDVQTTDRQLDRIIGLDTFLSRIAFDPDSFSKGVLTYKSLVLTLWAKDRMNLTPDLSPIATGDFKKFFQDLFRPESGSVDNALTDDVQLADLILWAQEQSGEDVSKDLETVLTRLIAEIREEYETIDPAHIDPRFMPHFLLT